MAKKDKLIKILPRTKQVLVKPDKTESRVSDSGLITPSNIEQEQRAIGTVLAVGKGIDDINKGDRVIYGAYAGETISIRESAGDVEYKLLHDDDVLALVQD